MTSLFGYSIYDPPIIHRYTVFLGVCVVMPFATVTVEACEFFGFSNFLDQIDRSR